jgi:hypothetical protein
LIEASHQTSFRRIDHDSWRNRPAFLSPNDAKVCVSHGLNQFAVWVVFGQGLIAQTIKSRNLTWMFSFFLCSFGVRFLFCSTTAYCGSKRTNGNASFRSLDLIPLDRLPTLLLRSLHLILHSMFVRPHRHSLRTSIISSVIAFIYPQKTCLVPGRSGFVSGQYWPTTLLSISPTLFNRFTSIALDRLFLDLFSFDRFIDVHTCNSTLTRHHFNPKTVYYQKILFIYSTLFASFFSLYPSSSKPSAL